MKRWFLLLGSALLIISLPGCRSNPEQPAESVLQPVDTTDLRLVKGQTVYIPAYAEIFTESDKTLTLTVTLAIHNTDPDHALILHSVRYYDTNGALVKDYLDTPVEIGPLATAGYVIGDDMRGGWGANFIVEWGADTDIYEPVIEAVMIGSSFGQGISLISPGRVIHQTVQED